MTIRPALRKLQSLRRADGPPTVLGKVARSGLVGAFFFALGFAYLYPGSLALVRGRTDVVMSDDTDISPLPYAYDALVRAVEGDWRRFFFGAVVLDQGHPFHDTPAWFSWGERTIAYVGHFVVPIEQLSTLVAYFVMVASALAFYALGRAWRWREPVSIALGAAWAFNPFTRARAQVHTAMAGTFHLPLIFLGLHLVSRGRTRRSTLAAAACFLLAATTIQYLLITAAALTPFFVLYLALDRGTHSYARLARRAVLAALPAVLFLGWNVAKPVPADSGLAADQKFPQTGRVPPGVVHPFLTTYAARPIDYFGSDLAQPNRAEWLPPRAAVNEHILKNLENSLPHERTNGIRWSLLVLALLAVACARGRERRQVCFFVSLGAASFWLSLPPSELFGGFGPSRWLWELVPQIRVPSRAGIVVHFAVLALVGRLFATSKRTRWRRALAWAMPLLVIVDYPPLATPMTMAPVRPRFEHLRHGDGCATGLYFPFVNDDLYSVIYYRFKQRLRGTGCSFVNALNDPAHTTALHRRFQTSNEFLRTLEGDGPAVDSLVKFARCGPLGWIAFDEITPAPFLQQVCRRLGWTLNEDLTCVDPKPVAPYRRTPDGCP